MSLQDVRRVITVHDESGKAVVQVDSITPHKHAAPNGGPVSHGLWVTGSTPAEAAGVADRFAGQMGITPPKNGTIFTIVDFAPSQEPPPGVDNEAMQRRLGPEHSSPKARKPSHPAMHRTRTVDYGIVLSGEIDMVMDDSELHLKPGDVVIQQATNHAWINRGKVVCRIAFVLIDAVEPLR
jgi:mannose-6-phosphate isomerase-like protein (cupin superfamily)